MNQNRTSKGVINITLNSSYFLFKIYISRASIKEDLIFYPMEKM